MLLSEIALYLENHGVGVRAENLFAGEIPIGAPGLAIGLLETGGGPPPFVHDRNDRLVETPGLQVRVRGTRYEEARQKMEDVITVLTFRRQMISGVRYLSVLPTQSPIDLGRDGNDRHLLVCNFDVSKEPS